MKFGTYFAYWAKEWKVSYFDYIERAAKCGFDLLEISTGILDLSAEERAELRAAAKDAGLRLTMGFGPPKEFDLSSSDEGVRRHGIAHMKKLFAAMDEVDIRKIGGAIYAYWPYDYSLPVEKERMLENSRKSMLELAEAAAAYGIVLNCEVLNRFEQCLLNTAEEGVAFVRSVDRPNVRVMLDTFHMNIEEDSFTAAIRACGPLLGHFHVGEANRKVPQPGRMPWTEIAAALKSIGYEGDVVMEPFVKAGGGVGQDIKVWRDLSGGADAAQLDESIKQSLEFLRRTFA